MYKNLQLRFLLRVYRRKGLMTAYIKQKMDDLMADMLMCFH